MPGNLRSVRKTAKSGRRQSAGQFPPTGGLFPLIMEKFKQVYRSNTAAHLAALTGADFKHCEKCLGGTRQLGGDYLMNLLRSDFGEHAWKIIMAGSKAKWHRGVQRQQDISKLRTAQATLARQLAQLEAEAGE